MYHLHYHEFHHAMPLGTMNCVYCGALKVHHPHNDHAKATKSHRPAIRLSGKRSILVSTMIADLERRVNELRFVDGIEKVEHVPYQTGDQFWVRFNRPLDFQRLDEIVQKHGYVMVKFAGVPSKLPRGLAELLWDGITHVVAKRISDWSRFTSNLGFEPDGIAKLAVDLHSPYRIFIATEEEGIQLLYEYLGLKYVSPPAPAPKPAAPVKPVAPTVTKPTQPTTPATPSVASPSPKGQTAQTAPQNTAV